MRPRARVGRGSAAHLFAVAEQLAARAATPSTRLRYAQATANAAAADLPALDEATMERVRAVYEDRIAAHVDQRW